MLIAILARRVDRIQHLFLLAGHLFPVPAHEQEVDLVNVEFVILGGTIFDRPIFCCPLGGHDCGRRIHAD